MEVSCRSCGASFATKGKRDQHAQRYHQMKTTVKFSTGEVIELERNKKTTHFVCPKCDARFGWPKAIQRHASIRCLTVPKKKTAKLMESSRSISSIDPLLRSFQLYANHRVGVLICNRCQCCIGHEVSQVIAHLKRAHKVAANHVPSPPDLLASLHGVEFLSEDDMVVYPGSSEQPIRPIEGLPVHLDGRMCTECKYLCCSQTIRHHIATSGHTHVERVLLQTCFKGPRRNYFRVCSSINSSESTNNDGTDNVDDFATQELQAFAHYIDGRKAITSDERMVPPLLQKLKWYKQIPLLVGCDCQTLIEVGKLPQKLTGEASAVYNNVRAAVASYFQHGTRLITSASYLTRRCVLAGSTEVKDTPKGFNEVEDVTGNYQRHMTRMIFMIKTCYDRKQSSEPVWAFLTSSNVDAAVVDFFRSCSTEHFDPAPKHAICQLQRVLQAVFVSESLSSCTTSENDITRYSVYRYVIVASITGGDFENMEVMDANNITSICAALIYWSRLFILVSLMDPSKAPAGMSAEVLLTYVRDGKPTAFNALLEIMKLGKYLSGPTEGQRPVGYWQDSQKDAYICKGIITKRDSLQRLALDITRRFKDQLQWRLLRGFDTKVIRRQISTFEFTDLINTRATNQWFMSRPENKLTSTSRDFLSYLMSVPGGSMSMMTKSKQWDEKRVREWLQECDEFMDLFLFAVHLTSGQPARASELASLRIRDSNLAFRSVYSIRNRLTFLSCYHKSMKVTGKFKPIARFAPLVLSADILLYFDLVRPVQAYFHETIKITTRGASYLDYVFVKRHGAMDAEQIRASIAKGFAAFSEMKFDVSTYRHVAVAFMEAYVRPGLIRTDLLDEQAGHSHQVANTVYARNANDPSSLSRDQLDEFWKASEEWQAFLGLEVQARTPRLSTTSTTSEDSNALTSASPAPQHASRIKKLTFLQAVPCLDNGEASGAYSVRATRPDKLYNPSRDVSATSFVKAKRVIERFVGVDNTSFTCPEQGLALATLLDMPPKHRIIVLPTGGGKSVLYMAHFIDNPTSDKTSLVVVPSAALLNESVLKCKLKQITACKYSKEVSRSGTHFSIVFAAVEQLRIEELRTYLLMLANLSKLHMVFIDEAHLVMTSAYYRPDMLYTPTLIELSVPLTLLSATIPECMENDFSRSFHVEFSTIRACTNRINLKYSVKVSDRLFDDVVKVMMVHQNRLAHTKHRCIAYCMTRNEVDELCRLVSMESVSVSGYHAKMSVQDQSRSIAQWRSGRSVWMIATSAFGVGIDNPHVRLVLHVGSTYSLIDYAQETGRGGRDGNPCEALTITSTQYQLTRERSLNGKQLENLREMNTFLRDTMRCRRQHLQNFLDGVGFPCPADLGNQLCDVCDNIIGQDVASTPAVRSNGDVDLAGRVARQSQTNSIVIQADIRAFMNQMRRSPCGVCWVRGRTNHQNDIPCPWIGYNCLKCQQPGHGARSCPLAIHFEHGTCFMCGLPWLDFTGVGSLHAPHNYSPCSNPARGFMIPAVWASFNCMAVKGVPSSATEYAEWLPKSSKLSKFSNLVVVFHELIKAKGAVPDSGCGLIS